MTDIDTEDNPGFIEDYFLQIIENMAELSVREKKATEELFQQVTKKLYESFTERSSNMAQSADVITDADFEPQNVVAEPTLTCKDMHEEEQLLAVIIEIINEFDDYAFKNPYNKQKVIGIFKELLLGSFNGKNIKFRADLINDLSTSKKGHHSKYQYKGLNLKAFAEIIGYLIKKHVISKSVTLVSIASLIANMAKNQKLTDNDDDKCDSEKSLASYMGNANKERYDSKTVYKGRWKLIDDVLKKCKNQ